MRFTLRIFWLLVLGLSLDSSASADYLTSYANGLAAFERERWPQAAEWFRKGIEEQPAAGKSLSVSGRDDLYLPHYYLGLALYHAGALEEAAEAWRRSVEQGVLSRERPEFQAQLDAYRFDVAEQLGHAQLVRADRLIGELEDPDRQAAVDADRELGGLYQETVAKLRQARRSHGRANESGNLPTLQEAWALAAASADSLELIVFTVNAQGQLARADRKVIRLDEPDLRAVLEADSSLRAERNEAIEKLKEARQIYEEARESGDRSALQEVHALAVIAAGMLDHVLLSVLALREEE